MSSNASSLKSAYWRRTASTLTFIAFLPNRLLRKPGTDMSFRRSLPETRCLSQGLPPGYARAFVRSPKRSTAPFTGVPRGGPRRYNRVAVLRFWLLILVAAAAPAQVLYEVSGRIRPEGRASVTLFGVTQPFTTSTFTHASGRFTFNKLAAATYTPAGFQPGR